MIVFVIIVFAVIGFVVFDVVVVFAFRPFRKLLAVILLPLSVSSSMLIPHLLTLLYLKGKQITFKE